MDYKPLFDRLLIKPLSSEQNISGLVIPDTSSNLKKGSVVSAGNGKPGIPMSVKDGQEILYRQDDAVPFTYNGEQYVILTEKDVWMIKP